MAVTDLSRIRNVALVAHQGEGKTLLTEALLFHARALSTFSAMGGRPCPLDEDPEEKERQTTLYPQVYNFVHHDHEINIIDTPGFRNFLADTRYCVLAADAAILIVSAISNVKETSREYWEAIEEFNIPRVIFINKMDREKANFENTLASIEDGFNVHPVCLTIPMGTEHNLSGIIDLLKMKAFKYSSEKNGKFQESDIPEEFIEQAKKHREKLMESIIETDDALMSAYLDGKDINFEQLLPLLKEGISQRQIIPVFAGSTSLDIGVTQLLEALCDYLPSPDKHKTEWTGTKEDGTKTTRLTSREAPFSGFVFKTHVDHFAGKVNYCRIVSGTIKLNDVVLITTQDKKTRMAHIVKPLGRKVNKVNEASAGEIVALEKVDFLETSDTISDLKETIIYPTVLRPEKLISFAVVTKDRASEEKVMDALHKIMEEDPNIEYHWDKETRELLLSGMGQFHIEIVKQILKRKYDVVIELGIPKVPYRETIKKTARAQGKHKKQSGGHGQYGDCWIELSPLPRKKGFEFVNKIVGGAIPKNYIPAVEKGVKEALDGGYLAGFPVVDVRATVYDGSYHDVDSSDMAFKLAGILAFKKCMEQTNPTLLEPIMDVQITVPFDALGAAIQDLNSRRGKVMGVDPKGTVQVIRVLVPFAEMVTYDNTLKGLTQGKGHFVMSHSTYEEVPAHLAPKIIEERKKEKEAAG